MTTVNLLGHGFIGRRYAELYPCIINDRDDLKVKHHNVLYMISTVDNYNVFTDPYLDIETNLITLVRALESCRQLDNVVFNFVSSWYVYGKSPTPFTEDSYCNPTGFYSITKRAAEQLLMSYCETFDLNYRILRLANVVGPGDPKVSTKKNALTYLIRKIKEGHDIELYDGGNFTRDYIHVDDVCKAINLVVENGKIDSVYNISNNQSSLFKDVIQYVIDKVDSPSKIKTIGQADFHKIVQVKSSDIDSSKLFALGYKPAWTLERILDDLIQNG